MFHKISPQIFNQMQLLELIDREDRIDGTSQLERLRQIPPETGKFLALSLANAPDGEIIEIGTSAGYSTLWLSLACREIERKIISYEILPKKVNIAKNTFQKAGIEDLIDLVEGDARNHIHEFNEIAFCFLDAEKDVYQDCYDLIIPKLVRGGILIADNAINHSIALTDIIDFALHDKRIDAMVLPIGKGLLYCRKS